MTDYNLEDWQNLGRRPYHVRRPEGCATGFCIHDPVPRPCYWPAVLRLLHRSRWTGVLQARRGQAPLPGQGHAAADLPVSPEQPGEGEACWRGRYLYGRLLVDVDMGSGLNQSIYRIRKGSRWVRGVKESGFPGRGRGSPSVSKAAGKLLEHCDSGFVFFLDDLALIRLGFISIRTCGSIDLITWNCAVL